MARLRAGVLASVPAAVTAAAGAPPRADVAGSTALGGRSRLVARAGRLLPLLPSASHTALSPSPHLCYKTKVHGKVDSEKIMGVKGIFWHQDFSTICLSDRVVSNSQPAPAIVPGKDQWVPPTKLPTHTFSEKAPLPLFGCQLLCGSASLIRQPVPKARLSLLSPQVHIHTI